MLDDRLLDVYMNGFYGYGNYRGSWWLVGMEEGGGDSPDDISGRLNVWTARGRRELEDVDIFTRPDQAKWFTTRPPLQPTWRGLIRLILAAEGRPTDPETARIFQGAELGRTNGSTCILELLPLPSPSIGQWTYGTRSGLGLLRDRQTYTDHIAPQRVAHIRKRINEHEPKAVIFYSRKYQAWWEQIAGGCFKPAGDSDIQMLKTHDTLFVMTLHPTYRGVTTEYFVKAGLAVAAASRDR